MQVEISKSHICVGLKRNFLYRGDIGSLKSLMSFYDINMGVQNIFPKYVSMGILRNKIAKAIAYRSDAHCISRSLSLQIHEDINRLELYIYLDGYIQGFNNANLANALEKEALKFYKSSDLANKKYLFQFKNVNRDVRNFKKRLRSELIKDEKKRGKVLATVYEFSNKVIKDKTYSLNKYVDRQLELDRDGINPASIMIPKEDLKIIYKETFKFILNTCTNLYTDAYWNGLNERVLKRYR